MSASTQISRAAWLPAAAAILLLGFACTRLLGLGDLVMWHDEVFTLVRAFGHSQEALAGAIFSGTLISPDDLLAFQRSDPGLGWAETWRAFANHPEHAPLYYLLVRIAAGATAGLGLSPVEAARGVSALAGIALIPAAFWLARELFRRGPAPWVAALLVASSPMALLYAQEARQYALWTLLVVLSSAALLRALRRDGGQATWWIYGTTLVLGLYSHLLFMLVLGVHAIYLVLALDRGRLRQVLRPWGITVGVSLLAFSPWIAVILLHHEQAADYTAWMARPIGISRNLAEWGDHLTRVFVDLDPGAPGPWGLLLIPLALALILFIRHAPRPAMWLPLGIILAYIGVVLVPDLVFDGSRSQHVRYALPAMLAVQLVVAWVIAAGLTARAPMWRTIAAGALGLALVLGGLSILRIHQADTWWSKQFSASNGEVARIVNGWQHPLVVAGSFGVSAGELISLAHRLDPGVRVWGDKDGQAPPLTPYSDVLVLLPSPALAARLERAGSLVPVAGTWQWQRLQPASLDTGEQAAATGSRP